MNAPVPTVPAWLRVTAMTHRGLVRSSNQDSLVLGGMTGCGIEMTAPISVRLPLAGPVVVAVADGMGGHAAGDVASAHAVRSLAEAAPGDGDTLSETLVRVDADLQDISAAEPQVAGLGTTVAGVLFGHPGGVWFTVGDSRVYQEQDGELTLLSTDDRGPFGGLTQCLGGGPGHVPVPHVEPLAPFDGRILLCSDGLSDLLGTGDLHHLLTSDKDPAGQVTALVNAALDAGGHDNITVIVIDPT